MGRGRGVEERDRKEKKSSNASGRFSEYESLAKRGPLGRWKKRGLCRVKKNEWQLASFSFCVFSMIRVHAPMWMEMLVWPLELELELVLAA